MSRGPVEVGMRPPHPGAFVRAEILDELSLSVARAAEILGVRRATLSDLVNEKASLSAEMALRIEKAFGVSMDTLLQMQVWHDSSAMRQRAGEIEISRYKPAPKAEASGTKDMADLKTLLLAPTPRSDTLVPPRGSLRRRPVVALD